MPHPRTYQDSDPFLAELRQLCLDFPESTEVEAWGRPTFRAGKKMFAIFTSDDESSFSVVFKPDTTERPALVQDPRFFAPRYWAARGWLGLDLSAAPVDWAEVAELVESSYRQVALKRMLAALDAR